MESYHNKGELKYFNKNYSFNNALSIPLILNQIFQFLDIDKIKCLSLCNKEIYQIYCNQVKKLKIKEKSEKPKLQVLIGKYDNVKNLDLRSCKNIEDFTPLSKLERLETLNVSNINISDISFLENNKNIKELNLNYCKKIKDFKPKLKNLQIL